MNDQRCPGRQTLKQMLEGDLSQRETADVASHLETCDMCRQLYEELAAAMQPAREAADQPLAREPALHQVMKSLEREGPGNSWHTHVTAAESGDDRPRAGLDFLAPTDDPQLLGLLGIYEILEVVGRGGMGVVLKARDPRLNRYVAIKALAPHLAQSGAARQRFFREAQAAAAVSHDHVVTIHSVEEANGLPILVMEFVSGVSLQQRIDRDGPLELRKILRISSQAAAGLAAAHAQGLIHRDIKPGNILLENSVERVKLTDFGLARAADDLVLTQTGILAGTPLYMSPEQAQGRLIDARSDLFSLGSVMYTMCTGRPAFRAETPYGVIHRVCHDQPRSISEVNPELPPGLIGIVARLMAKNPDQRFQSAAEVAELLNRQLMNTQQPSRGVQEHLAAASFEAPAAKPPTSRPSHGQRRSHAAWLVGCAVVVLLLPLLLGGALWITYYRIREKPAQPATPLSDIQQMEMEILEPERASGFEPLVVKAAEVARLEDHRRQITALKWDPGRNVVASGDAEGFVRLWDPLTGVKLATIIESQKQVMDLAFSSDGQFLAWTTPSNWVYIWNVQSQGLEASLDLFSTGLFGSGGSSIGLSAVAFSPDSSTLAIGTYSGVFVWQRWQSGPATESEPGFFWRPLRLPGRASSVAFSPDGKMLAASDNLGMVRVWDTEIWDEVKEFEAHRDETWLAFSPDGSRLATVTRGRQSLNLASGAGKGEGVLRLWDTTDWRLLGTWGPAAPDHELTSLEFLPDGKTLVTGGEAVIAWDLSQPNSGRVFSQRGHSIAVSPDGNYLAVGYSTTATVWDVGGIGD